MKALANHVGLKKEDGQTLLAGHFQGLSLVSPRSVLSSYLEMKPLKKEEKPPTILFPFGFNSSQKSAAEKAMKDQVSIIEGPPGTGKTQTILNIIANAIMNDKTVAVVSNNNDATANVFEKLQKHGLEFIAASLGNKKNRDNFFNEQDDTYPAINDWKLDEEEYQSIDAKLRGEQQRLTHMLERKNRLASLKQELSNLKLEHQYFLDYLSTTDVEGLKLKTLFRLSADKVLSILVSYKKMAEKEKIKGSSKIWQFIVHGIYSFKIYSYPAEEVVTFLQMKYYELKMQELTTEMDKIAQELESYHFDSAMEEYREASMKLFKASLAKRYGSKRERTQFGKKALCNDFERFIKDYPLILSTTHSLRNCAPKNYLFDYVLVDEASQVDIVTGTLALSSAKNAVIVGDLKQLPNVVTDEVRNVTDRVFASYRLSSSYHFAEQSLLSSMINLYADIPRTLLKEHYRCHPKIIGFCNQKFYNNELIVLTEDEKTESPIKLYQTVKGDHARERVNQRQVDVVFNEVLPQQNNAEQSVGITTPYRPQANKLQEHNVMPEIQADTVHKYQGREKDMMILSTVSNKVKVNDFVDKPDLINVAVSRAKEKLVVVVADGSESWHGTNIGDLVKYIKYNNFEIIQSEIRSVFDLLYSSYSDKLLKVMANIKKVSKYQSENLMNAVIEDVLGENEFIGLDHVLHQPLRMLIKDPGKLNENERTYAMNILTHADFVIFNKMDKMPVLVVEVDGHAYHENNPTQLRRDEMKDTILKKYSIPIVRMKTTESEEETILRNKLKELLRLSTG
ncbi:AAA domain-containing protein [Halobacillus shinanisalinarum]|uniref:AAA domain-containing protein n=1 Tax=Halobacillus shinanisalinarum TaxID=2932258 RepID=A0ABY4GZ44_9BACI|nr:AAA domain-containing protein [Halobacillus shinanisalinarum]UOQ92047.1 AAA domain-containing protein [Halobacillus shinanisalinarum]